MKIYGAQLTGSIASTGNPVVTGSLTVSGNLTAQQFIVSSSVTFLTTSFSSGSTKFGDSSDDNHNFTGSVLMTGSLTVVTTGNEFQVNAGGVNIGNALTDNHIISGSVRINPNGLFVSSSGIVGIGSTTPSFKLETLGSSVIVAGFGRSDYGASNVMLIGMSGYRDVYKSAIGVVRTGDYDVGNMIFCLNSAANGTAVSASDERMRITSTGNVGIGTTSVVANDGDSKTLQLGNRLVVQNVIGTQFLIGTNAYYDGTWKYISAAKYQAVRGTGESGAIQFHLASAGTAGGTITNMDGSDIKMIIKESGNVGIGTTSPSEKLHVYGGGLGPEVKLEGTFGSFYIRVYNDNFNIYTPQGRNAISIANNGNVYNYSNTTSWQTTSDIRVKENINTIENALNVITSLNPVSFNYKQEFAEKNNWDDTMKLNNIGFIAQEFENVFPKYVYTKEYTLGDTPIEDFKSIDTGHLVPYLVKAIQEQQIQINELKSLLNS